MPPPMKNCITITLTLAGLNGCSTDAPAPGRTEGVARDSAEISIVENSAPSTADSTAWYIDTSRVALIGGNGSGAGEGHNLGSIAGFERLSDGRIVVADREAAQIHEYDSTGVYLRSMGRPGTGPGEFDYFTSMHKLIGDTLLIVDHEGQRRTIFSPQGNFVRSYSALRTVVPGARFPRTRHVVKFLPDGSYLMGEERSACAQITILQLVNQGGQ